MKKGRRQRHLPEIRLEEQKMTAQRSDCVLFKEKKYAICGVKGEGLFDPRNFDIPTVWVQSCCWKGFYCLYSIEEEELRLVSFSTGYNGLERIKIKYGKGKEFLGQKPVLKDDSYAHYENLPCFRVNFTGSLLIGTDYIENLPRHGGVVQPFYFQEVLEVFIQNGKVQNIVDCSQQVSATREENHLSQELS